ncbi:MAG: hypothetical protein COT14_00480 [Candidatus Diapherotrites archaeon CG08_land_8_20_14_0_20_30_16]|nr:MAG: hypothetical protein COT14_00480 [Candidatus Diapherotrites archaeon CG08_land_8_20_14_0_20_30_16]
MLKKGELKVLLELISKKQKDFKLSASQRYLLMNSLKTKGVLLKNSTICSDLILKMLLLCEKYPKLQELICDGKLSILFILINPKSLDDLIFLTQYTKAYILRVIKESKRIGLVRKIENKYVLNSEIWQEFISILPHYMSIFMQEYNVNKEANLYYISPKKILFSSKKKYSDYYIASFSILHKHNLLIYTLEEYYSNIKTEQILDIFRDLLLVLEKDTDHRLKTIAVLFYKKYESLLKDLNLSFVNDVKLVLKGQKVAGFLPLKEIIEKGEVYDIEF